MIFIDRNQDNKTQGAFWDAWGELKYYDRTRKEKSTGGADAEGIAGKQKSD